MNKQKVFNTVSQHLLTQNYKAEDERGNCSYRTGEGLKCAIGCLIPDELYTSRIEGKLVPCGLFGFINSVEHQLIEILRKAIGVEDKDDLIFLNELQMIHDCSHPDDWEIKLKAFAEKHQLKYT